MLPQARLDALKQKHARISALIEKEESRSAVDERTIKLLKRQKLVLKDEIEGTIPEVEEGRKGRLLA